MLLVGEIGAWLSGNLLSTGHWKPHLLPAALVASPYDKAVAMVVTPFIVLAFAGTILL